MRIFVILTLTILLIPQILLAEKMSGISLGTGIVFPSGNSAILLNPSGIFRKGSNILGEVIAGIPVGDNNGLDFTGSVVAGNERIAGGAEFDYIDTGSASAKSLTGALAFGVSTVSIGGNFSYNIDSKGYDFDAGLTWDFAGNFSLGVLTTNLKGGPDAIYGGLGFRDARFYVEGDVGYFIEGSGTTLYFSFGGGITLVPKLTITAGYRFLYVKPETGDSDITGNDIFAGIYYQLTDMIGLEGRYNYSPAEFTAGATLAF